MSERPTKQDEIEPSAQDAPDAADQRETQPKSEKIEPAVLPQRSRDEQDVGWGDQPTSDDRDADWYRRERPPHHGD